MAKRPNISDISSIYNSAATINENFDNVEEAFDNTLSRDGSSPNQMEADLDLNGNDILNAGNIYSDGDNLTEALAEAVAAAEASENAAASSEANAASSESNAASSAASASNSDFNASVSAGAALSSENSAAASAASASDSALSAALSAENARMGYVTKADFVADFGGRSWTDGTTVNAGGIQYVYETGEDSIADLPGFKAVGEYWKELDEYRVFNVLDYIGRQPGGFLEVQRVTTRNQFQDEDVVTAGFQAAVDAAVASNDDYIIYAPMGTYVLSSEIDFTATNPDVHFGLKGAGKMNTIFQVHPNFGQSSKLFNMDNADNINKSKITNHGFRILGSTEYEQVVGDRDTDPMGIYAPYIGTNSTFSAISMTNLGNVGIWNEDVDNSDFYDIDLSGVGFQKTSKTLGAIYASGSDGSTTLTAYESDGTTLAVGTFTGTEGEKLAIADADGGNDHIVRVVDTVPGDGSSCTITEALPEAVNVAHSRKITYLPPMGSITSGTNTLTLTTDALTDADVGRPIWVEGAAENNELLQSYIVSRVGNVLTLADNATVTATDAKVILGAAWVVSRFESDRNDPGLTNDMNFQNIRVEAYHGVGLIMENATRIFMNQTKFHARQIVSNNFANSMEQMYLGDVDGSFDCEFDRAFAHDSAHIVIVGLNPHIKITGSSTRYHRDDHLIYFNSTGVRAALFLGLHHVDTDGVKQPVRTGSSALYSAVRQIGSAPAYRQDIADEDFKFVQMGNVVEATAYNAFSEIVMPDESLFIIDPKLEYGVMTISSSSSNGSGFISFRAGTRISGIHLESGVGVAHMGGKTADEAVVTDGTDVLFTVRTTSDDKLVLFNRRGFSTKVVVSFTGAGLSGEIN